MHEIKREEPSPILRDYGASPMNRAERRRIDRMVRQDRDAPAPATEDVKDANAAGMARAAYYRGKLDRALAEGQEAAAREGKAMLIGLFAHLVEHSSIEDATRTLSRAVSDIAGQALIKRARDIQAGKRPPMKSGESANG